MAGRAAAGISVTGKAQLPSGTIRCRFGPIRKVAPTGRMLTQSVLCCKMHVDNSYQKKKKKTHLNQMFKQGTVVKKSVINFARLLHSNTGFGHLYSNEITHCLAKQLDE